MSKSTNRTGRAIGAVLAALGIGARREGEGLGEAIRRVQGEASNEYATALRQANERRRALEATVPARLAEARRSGGRAGEDNERERIMAEREAVLTRDDGVVALAAALGRTEAEIIADAKDVGRLDELVASLSRGSDAANREALDAAQAEAAAAALEVEAAQRRLVAAQARFKNVLGAIEGRTRAADELATLRATKSWLAGNDTTSPAPKRSEPKRREPRRAEPRGAEVAKVEAGLLSA